MEKPNPRIIGNAISAYFLFFVCITFLWSKNPYINDNFVKNHVKTAFILHLIFVVMLFIMSYPIGENISIIGYSINTIIQIILSLIIFAGLFYGAFCASKGKTLTFGEMFHTGTGKSTELLSSTKTENIGEEDKTLLTLTHIPFVGYIFYPSHKNLPHIRDIIQLNFITTLICVLLYIFGISSLANLLFLAYTIWSVFVSINLFVHDTILALNMSFFPTVSEKYLLQKSLVRYFKNMMRKKKFIEFKDILSSQNTIYKQKESLYKENIVKKPSSSIPSFIYYIPGINILGLFMLKTNDTYHIRYGLFIAIITAVIIYFYGVNHPVLFLVLFPISFGIGYLYKKEYVMPYIDDIMSFILFISYKISHIFSRAKKLRKTEIKESITMNTQKKES